MRQFLSYSFTAVLSLAIIWLAGCASSKSMAYDPSGNWNYTVTGTPNGTVEGTMTITKNGDSYSGELQSPIGSTNLNNLKIEGQTLSADFYYSGTEIQMSGTFDGDSFDGEVAAGYDSFDITANRAD